MGLIGGLLTLPLTPVRGVVLLAEALEREAERELVEQGATFAALSELDAMRDSGEQDVRDVDELEDALVQRVLATRGVTFEGGDGDGER